MLQNRIKSILQHKLASTAYFYIASLAFILLSAYLLLKKDTLLWALIPFAIVAILAAIYSYEKLLWLAVFCTPFSVPLHELIGGLPFDMFLPTEPILVSILFLFFLAWFSGKRLSKELVYHPVSLVIYLYLGWMLLASFSSSLPMVSFKMVLNRTWFIVAFYFLAAKLFENPKNFTRYVWLYVIPFLPVIFYTIYRHMGYGLWDNQAAHFVMDPFFNDHTSYGAALAFYIPFLIAFSLSDWIPVKYKPWIVAVLVIFLIAEVLSYTRASWLSLFIGFGVWTIIKLKLKFKKIFITLLALFAIVFVFQDQILMRLEKNSQDSSSNLTEHLSSMTNISTDASNLERLNRWNCAIKMFKEKPVFGWGPGTYAMKYGSFQVNKDRTIISTNSGDGGNAHSEYLGSLAESGVMGLVNYLLLIIVVLYIGINAYTRVKDKRLKTIALAAIVGLVTYYFHGILNNFLDTDKITVPFWGFTAMLVAIDIYSKREEKILVEKTKADKIQSGV